jgi:hypothetical protein
MTCHDARESLSAFLDEALTPDERRPIEAHLEGCAECRRELERLRHTVALLHRVEPARAPVGFVDRVTTAARPRPWYRRVAAAAFLPLSVKVPAEVTALVMVALLAIYVFERTPALQQAAREETARPAPSIQLADKPGRPEPGQRAVPEGQGIVPERQRTVEIARQAERRMERDSSPGSVAPPPLAAPSPSAPPASSPPVAATPPAAKTEPPSESQVGSGARMEAASRKELLERPPDPVRAAPAPKLAAQRAQPSADVVARVAVKDRDAAERELAQLIARVGGSEAQRRRADAATTVEALIPQARYAEFAQGLTQIGTWQVESERPDLPTQVRVILRLAE